MTTIAFDGKVLASDSRCTYCEDRESYYISTDKCKKIWRLPDGRLFGASRGAEDGLRLYELMKSAKPGTLPTLKLEDVNAIVVDLKGRIWFYEGNIWQRHEDSFIALGSGARVGGHALLKAGVGAADVVKRMIGIDPFSGGRVQVLTLKRRG